MFICLGLEDHTGFKDFVVTSRDMLLIYDTEDESIETIDYDVIYRSKIKIENLVHVGNGLFSVVCSDYRVLKSHNKNHRLEWSWNTVKVDNQTYKFHMMGYYLCVNNTRLLRMWLSGGEIIYRIERCRLLGSLILVDVIFCFECIKMFGYNTYTSVFRGAVLINISAGECMIYHTEYLNNSVNFGISVVHGVDTVLKSKLVAAGIK